MLSRLLRNSEAKQFASFVSPAFFDVMPTSELWSRARELRATRKDSDAIERARAERAETLARSDLAISLKHSGEEDEKPGNGEAMPPEARAEEVAALYFHQLFLGERVIFDLRARAFASKARALVWDPKPWVVTFSSEFVGPMRQIYRGFYESDDSLFRRGLEALELDNAEAVFRKHFGEGQEAVRFRTKDFLDSFHEVFLCCRDGGTRLHADFLPLGLYLATLYDHLESLDVPVNVERAFRRGAGPVSN